MNKLSRENCSTLIVGKNASKSGMIILAHNEDDTDAFVQSHLVPHLMHEEGEILTFDDSSAAVPQVKETLAFYWSEYRGPVGIPFADLFFNECGVAVVSNAMDGKASEEEAVLKAGGALGYGLRRIIAERAHSAKDGVGILAELMKAHGYYSSRSYTIADRNEAWVCQLAPGHQFAAQRVGDDEILYLPNWYTIHHPDFSDTSHDHSWCSDDIVSNAVKNGWYIPGDNDCSDFDFAVTYRSDNYAGVSNSARSDLAWKYISGEELPYQTFSIKAPCKYDIEDVKKIMRLHYQGHEEDLKFDPAVSPHRYGICRDTTVESVIFDFDENPALTVMHRALPRPCISPYMPWFAGITQIPEGYEWMGWKASLKSHFSCDEDEFRYHSHLAYWALHSLMNTMEFDYPFCQQKVHQGIEKLEKQWQLMIPDIRKAYRNISLTDTEAAAALITDFTAAAAHKTWRWADAVRQELTDSKNQANMRLWRSKIK